METAPYGKKQRGEIGNLTVPCLVVCAPQSSSHNATDVSSFTGIERLVEEKVFVASYPLHVVSLGMGIYFIIDQEIPDVKRILIIDIKTIQYKVIKNCIY